MRWMIYNHTVYRICLQMKGIIYKYTFPNGKVFIGQTRRHPEKRRREHFDDVVGPTNSGFWDAYKQFGMPKYEELFQIESEDVDKLVAELNNAETFFIHKFKADDPEYGYNRKSFGSVGTKTNVILSNYYKEYLNRCLEIRLKEYDNALDKILESKEPLTLEEIYLLKEKYREDNFWQKYIDDFNFDNLSSYSEEDLDFMCDECFDFVRRLIIKEAEEQTRQYIYDHLEQILDKEREKNAIVQLDKEGNIIREFYSFNDICQHFDVPRADNVKNVLKGRQKSAYGYLWKYKKDL